MLLILIVSGLLVNGCTGYAESSRKELPTIEPAVLSKDFAAGGYGRFSYYASPASGEAAPQGLPQAETPDIDPARQDRLVVYNGVINVVVQRISDSLKRIKSAVEEMGGYMQEMTTKSVTLKIPADKFEAAIALAEALGEVTQKDIKGTDVTDQMRDLDIRLKNSLQMRERLAKLLERAEKVEDALKIEKELQRITETIELLKGKIAHLKNSVAFSTLTVKLNSPVPQQDATKITPFAWVHALGSGLTTPAAKYPYEGGGAWRSSAFELPDGYVKYYEDGRQTRAMSADGVMIDFHKERNYKGGNIEFWGKLVRRVLVEQKVFHVEDAEELKLERKSDAVVLRGGKQIGSKEYGYLAAMAASKKYVYVFEAWGPAEQFEQDRQKIQSAIKSMRSR